MADALSKGFLINPIIPKLRGINDIIAITRKSMLEGNRSVYGIIRNEIVANNPNYEKLSALL